MTGVRPPAIARRLLEWVGGRRAQYMVGDLDEEFHRYVLPRVGHRRARSWYWRQVLRSLPAAARQPTRRRLVRTSSRAGFLASFIRETRFAVRNVLRVPRFSFAVILVLGVGVGAGASVFALVDMFLLRPPSHVVNPDRVRRVVLREHRPPAREVLSTSLAWVDYESLRDGADSFSDVAVWFPWRRSLGRGPGARNILVMMTTPSFFPLLGVRPALGRFFSASEDVVGLNPAPCVASDVFWRRELGGDDGAIGRVLTVGGITCTVIGVTPRGFNGVALETVHLWLPIRAAARDAMGPDFLLWRTDRAHWIRILARLAPGVREEVARDDATAAYRAFTDRSRDPDLTAVVELQSILPGGFAPSSAVDVSTMLLAGGGVLLMLIAANLANLFVVRDLGRARETAVRMALGSPRWRIVLTRVLEASVLGFGAGVVGLGVVGGLGPLVRSTIVTGVEFATGAVTLRVAAVTVGLAVLIGFAIAAAATLRIGREDPAVLLTSAGGSRAGSGRGAGAVGLGLVGLQTALSMALVVASLAFVNSFRQAAGEDLGFDRRNLLMASVSLEELNYSPEDTRRFYRDVWQTVREMPGVTSASLGIMTPWWNSRLEAVSVPGRDSLPHVEGYGPPVFDAVTPDYLTTTGLVMHTGRWFTDRDTRGSAPVLVINEALRDLYWPGESGLGRCMYVGDPPTHCREVIGVVGNHRFTGRLEDAPVGAYFLPLAQAAEYSFTPRLFVRTASEMEVAVPLIRQVVQGAVPNLPAATVFPLEHRFEPLIAPWRLGSYAFSALGLLATVVGTVGLFSILSYVVAERRREFAIRAAIGASSRQIALPVVWQGLMTVVAGVIAGLGLAVASSSWLHPLLFRTTLTNPWTVGLAAVVLLTVAVFATVLPARDAASRDPMEILRIE